MRLDSIRADSENHSLYCFRFFFPVRTRGFHQTFIFLYCQRVVGRCLSLTSCEKDALRLFVILDCHFIRENRFQSLQIDAAEHRALPLFWAALKAKVPIWHVSNSISNSFVPHTCQLNASLCFGALFHRHILFFTDISCCQVWLRRCQTVWLPDGALIIVWFVSL